MIIWASVAMLIWHSLSLQKPSRFQIYVFKSHWKQKLLVRSAESHRFLNRRKICLKASLNAAIGNILAHLTRCIPFNYMVSTPNTARKFVMKLETTFSHDLRHNRNI